jgi:energy-coupling factor transport system ATP-binding protein
VALAAIENLTFSYPGASAPALRDVSLCLGQGQVVSVLGPSGSGKSTLLRALAGLVPHFHGGRFAGRVEVAGLDTRRHGPAALAGTVAMLFQDPEDQLVFTRVLNEVAFGLENLGTPPREIERRALDALAAVGAEHLAGRAVAELSGGELQRVCLAATLALEPRLLLLDEPTSQLDPEAAEALVELACELARERGTTALISEQRPALPLELCERVLFLDGGGVAFDGEHEQALDWLAREHPAYLQSTAHQLPTHARVASPETVCKLDRVSFAYHDHLLVLDDVTLELRRGEVVALVGPNGSGKTTLAKLAAGLLDPLSGSVELSGRATYLSQDPGRYVFCERVDEEVAVGIGGDRAGAAAPLAQLGLAGYEQRNPRDLSSGERERLAIAAVLAPQPELLVLDEPTRGVDPERKLELARLVRGASQRATLLVTHDHAFAAAVADRTVDLAEAAEPVHV